MREVQLSDGRKVKFGPHFERQIAKRKMQLPDIRRTIEFPDIEEPDAEDPNGKKLTGIFDDFSMTLCINYDNAPGFIKTGWINP